MDFAQDSAQLYTYDQILCSVAVVVDCDLH